MTYVTMKDNKVLMKGANVTTGSECCCQTATCICSTLMFNNVTIRITLALPYGLLCWDRPIDIPISDVRTCENGVFSIYSDLDIDLCTEGGGAPCGSIIVHFAIVGECDCTSTDECALEIAGWEPINCDGGIANVEII